MRRLMPFLGTFLVGVPFLLTGCDKPATGEQKREPPKVTVALPEVRDVIDTAEFTGKIQAKDQVEIRARVAGELTEIKFSEGAMVGKNDPLFEIEKDTYETHLAAAQAQRKQTEASILLARSNLARDLAAEKSAKGSITQEQLDRRKAELDVAIAQELADIAREDEAGIELGYAVINAPITGLMGKSYVDVGNLVGASENTLLATIVRMDEMEVEFDVAEDVVIEGYLEKRRKNAGAKEEKTPIFVGLKNEEGFPHEGVIDNIDNQIDADTGTALVRGTIPNRRGFFYAGQFARVSIPLDPIKDAILVDEQALGTDLDGKYLLVVDSENIVHQRPVTLGPLIDGMRVIRPVKKKKDGKIISGLNPDERYVIVGIQRARPGLPVAPETASEAKSGGDDTAADEE